MQQELLIVGIDPGITTAYAVLDIEGNLVKLKSSRDLNLNALLQEITATGKVMVVGTDVKYSPGLIDKFARRLGAKVIAPQEDMKIGLKKRMTMLYKTRDDHQRDALAAALQAFRQTKPLLSKVDTALQRIGKEHLSDRVKQLVIQGHSIAWAVNTFEKTESNDVLKQKRRRTKITRSSRLAEENARIKKERHRALKKLRQLGKKLKRTESVVKALVQEKASNIVKQKNEKINFLQRQVGTYKENLLALQGEVAELQHVLLESRGKVIARKFQTLAFGEVHRNTFDCDVIIVDEVNNFSEKSLAYLRDKVNIIVYKTPPVKRLLASGFAFINAKKLSLLEVGNLVLIPEKELEEARKEKDMLTTILQEYRQEREDLV